MAGALENSEADAVKQSVASNLAGILRSSLHNLEDHVLALRCALCTPSICCLQSTCPAHMVSRRQPQQKLRQNSINCWKVGLTLRLWKQLNTGYQICLYFSYKNWCDSALRQRRRTSSSRTAFGARTARWSAVCPLSQISSQPFRFCSSTKSTLMYIVTKCSQAFSRNINAWEHIVRNIKRNIVRND